jgi:hypothetical protein
MPTFIKLLKAYLEITFRYLLVSAATSLSARKTLSFQNTLIVGTGKSQVVTSSGNMVDAPSSHCAWQGTFRPPTDLQVHNAEENCCVPTFLNCEHFQLIFPLPLISAEQSFIGHFAQHYAHIHCFCRLSKLMATCRVDHH